MISDDIKTPRIITNLNFWKILSFSLLVFSYSFSLAQSAIVNNIANKTEAKNKIVNGLKEGTWIEYNDSAYLVTKDTTAPYYMVSLYKDSEHWGIAQRYYKSGKLCTYYPFKKGKLEGIETWYYESGNIQYTIPFADNKVNGTRKEYYESGKIKTETTWSNDVVNGPARQYDENGKEINN